MLQGKRGETLTHWTIIQLALLALIGVSFFLFVARIRDDTSLQKTFLATDLAFLIEKLQTSPGDVSFPYTLGAVSLEKYTFSFADSRVRVMDKEQGVPFLYSFLIFPEITLDLPEQSDVAALYFVKDEHSLQLLDKATFSDLQDDPCIAVLRNIDVLFSDEQRTLVLISDTPDAHLLSSQVATAISDDLFQHKKLITVKDAISYDRSQLGLDDDLVLSLHVSPGTEDRTTITYGMTTQKQQGAVLGCRFAQALRANGFFVAAPKQSSAAFLQQNLNGIALRLDLTLSPDSSYRNPTTLALLLKDILSTSLEQSGDVDEQ